MEASATKTVMSSLGSKSVVAPSSLSSRSAFGLSPIVSVAPCKARAAPMTIRASASEEPKAGRREMLATLLAAGTVLSTGTALAGGLPDVGAGAKKLTKKAGKALENSPVPSGGGRIEGGLKDKNQARLANQSGIKPRVQETPGQRVDALENTEGAIAGNPLGEAADNVKGGIEDLAKNGPDKVKRDVKTAGDKVASNAGMGKKGMNQKGGDVANQVGSAAEKGKGVIGNIKDMVTDAIPQ